MRTNFLMFGMLMMLSAGCQTFSGQWLEEKGTPTTAEAGKKDYVRMALDFDPISAVRVGIYDETSGVVDAQSVQSDQYLVFDGGRVAQFGASMARLEGDRLTANVAGTTREFRRVRGKSIFPPLVRLPALTKSDPFAERYVTAWP